MKTSELQGAALDWAVAKADGLEFVIMNGGVFIPDWEGVDDPYKYQPSTVWDDAGPIIEREGIGFKLSGTLAFCAWKSYGIGKHQNEHSQYGPTPLVAAMRCYVASKLGDEIELPEELK